MIIFKYCSFRISLISVFWVFVQVQIWQKTGFLLFWVNFKNLPLLLNFPFLVKLTKIVFSSFLWNYQQNQHLRKFWQNYSLNKGSFINPSFSQKQQVASAPSSLQKWLAIINWMIDGRHPSCQKIIQLLTMHHTHMFLVSVLHGTVNHSIY